MKRATAGWIIAMAVSALLLAGAAIVRPSVVCYGATAQRARATADLDAMKVILSRFHQDHGRYPTEAEGFRVLHPEYLRITTFDDPWQHPYTYRLDAPDRPIYYARGTNGIDERGGGDDILPRPD